MKIKKWIRNGHNGDIDAETTDELLERAGRALDRAYSHEVMGEVLFEAEDGKVYVGTVEFVISEANPEYVNDRLEEDSQA